MASAAGVVGHQTTPAACFQPWAPRADMKRILVLEYSQSGDVSKAVAAFTAPFTGPDVQLHRERIQPEVPFPYPWRSVYRLFSVFPECFVPPPEGILPLTFQPQDRFDLVILSYQVWHLTPSIPIQAFFRSAYAQVLRDTPVITLCVSRNMWHSASETMKQLLRDVPAIHLDGVVLTHQGPPFSTFVSVPRALLYGKRDRLWGIFPPAELSPRQLERMTRLGGVVAARLNDIQPPYRPLLAGQGAVEVKWRYIIPEAGGWYLYRAAARVVTRVGRRSPLLRRLSISLFVFLMFVVIGLGIPLCLLVVLLLYPLLRGPIRRYAQRLAAPSGFGPLPPAQAPEPAGLLQPAAPMTPASTGPPDGGPG